MVNEVKDTPYYLYSLFSYRETGNKVHFIHSIHSGRQNRRLDRYALRRLMMVWWG